MHKHRFWAIGLGGGIVFMTLCAGAAEVKDLSQQEWILWLDREATWQTDPLFLPPVSLAEVPVHEPTGGWEALYTKAGKKVTLPATVEEHTWGDNGNVQGISGNYTGVSWFVTTFETPSDAQTKRLILHFDSVYLRAEVFVNETLVGYDMVHGTPFQLDIQPALKTTGTNRLAVRITDPFGDLSGERQTLNIWGDYHFPPSRGFGGITGRVWLEVSDRTYIEEVFVKNLPDKNTVEVDVTLHHLLNTPTQGTLTYQVIPSQGRAKTVVQAKEKVMALENRQLIRKRLKIKRAQRWSPESPYLYQLIVEWQGRGGTHDRLIRRFGVRWFDTLTQEGDSQFMLNDRRLVVRSAMTQGHWPINGVSSTEVLARRQVQAAKDLGLNMLHSRRDVGLPAVLTASDEMGLLHCEMMHWIDTGDVFLCAFQREKFLRLTKRDRHHPALVLYTISGSVVDTNRLYQEMADVHQLDESRCLTWQDSEPCQGWRPYQQERQELGLLWVQGDVKKSDLPRLAGIKEEMAIDGFLGWDGDAYLRRLEILDHFLDTKGFRDAFAHADDLCRSTGDVTLALQGWALANARVQNTLDGYLVPVWEDDKLTASVGLVDSHRQVKTDPNLLGQYSQPLTLVVQAREHVVGVDVEVAVAVILVNEKGVAGKHTLDLVAEDERGRYMEKSLEVQATGGQIVAETLVDEVWMATRSPGYTRVHATLRQGKREVATGQDTIYVVAYDPNAVTRSLAVWDSSGAMQHLLDLAGVQDYQECTSGLPDTTCLLMGGEVPLSWQEGLAWRDWVESGRCLVIVEQADQWADFLGAHHIVTTQGSRTWDLASEGNFFVRDHSLFAGLPVNRAMGWEYQSLSSTPGTIGLGLRLSGEQCVVGCFTWPRFEVLTAVGIIPLGRGKVILSTLDLKGAIQSKTPASLVAQQILLNYLDAGL